MRASGRRVLAALLVAAAVGCSERPLSAQTAADSMWAIHLLNRATYGPRQEDIELVLEMGIEGWLAWQMEPEAIDDSALAERLAAFEAAALSPTELLAAYPPRRLARRMLDQADSLTPELRRGRMHEAGIPTHSVGAPPGRIVADLAGAGPDRLLVQPFQRLLGEGAG